MAYIIECYNNKFLKLGNKSFCLLKIVLIFGFWEVERRVCFEGGICVFFFNKGRDLVFG